jgi:hypothetical protein
MPRTPESSKTSNSKGGAREAFTGAFLSERDAPQHRGANLSENEEAGAGFAHAGLCYAAQTLDGLFSYRGRLTASRPGMLIAVAIADGSGLGVCGLNFVNCAAPRPPGPGRPGGALGRGWFG